MASELERLIEVRKAIEHGDDLTGKLALPVTIGDLTIASGDSVAGALKKLGEAIAKQHGS